MKRTKYCGLFSKAEIGQTITTMGWVQAKRDMGGVVFVDLRDREGTLQVVFNLASLSQQEFLTAQGLKNESVIEVTGELCLRDEETYNPNTPTGEVELRAITICLLSQANSLPFAVDHSAVREDLRLTYRFLDLRRHEMLENLRFRHKLVSAVHRYLEKDGFIEVETPMLTKSTPEGARDYLVPSRVHPGQFYALPQSPQIFKQLLMVGGIDKYYQVARCFRDEDLRADRQPEFTQVDMELSFVEQEDILIHLEKLFKYIMKTVKGIEITKQFKRLTWQECMDVYGSDKPDLRFDLPIIDLTEFAKRCHFTVFRGIADKGGVVRAINIKGHGDLTRSMIEELTDNAMQYGAKGMAWIAIKPDGELYSILTKYLSKNELDEILETVDGKPGDFILFCADTLSTVRKTLGGLRLDIAQMVKLRQRKEDYQFLIVTDFPQFEYAQEEKRFVAMHHPFTMPYEEDIPYLISDPARVRAQAYDVVLNGVELGSGSIRIHRQEVQQQMFQALGFSDEEINSRFGFLVNAFQYGTPPHGGFAFGLDRLVMLLVGASSLRDVIAFPKNKDAACLLTNAPDVVSAQQLQVLDISTQNTQQQQTTSKQTSHQEPSADIDVDKVANLSKLILSKDETKKMKKDLSAIVAFANELAKIDTNNVPVTAHVLPMQNVWREDEVAQSFDRALLLQNVPKTENGYLYVPKVVE